MMRLLIAVLIVVNLALFGRLMGWLPGMLGDQPDAARLSRQVNPERLKILPEQPGARRRTQPGSQTHAGQPGARTRSGRAPHAGAPARPGAAMSHVFTYGSLMFERVWSRVVAGTYRAAAPAWPDSGGSGSGAQDYPSLDGLGDGRPEQDPGRARGQAAVDGVLYLDVEAADLAALDAFEGPDYRRIQVPVACGSRSRADRRRVPWSVADTYLFVADRQGRAGSWDPQEFERERMERFLRDYAPPARVCGRGPTPGRRRAARLRFPTTGWCALPSG